MSKRKKVRKPYRSDNFHHLLFGDSECSNLVIQDVTVDEINAAILDWQIIVDMALDRLLMGDESARYDLSQARREIQILKIQKRGILAKAI